MKESLENVEIKPFGDSALIVKFGSKIDPKIGKYIQSLQNNLNKLPFTGYIESVPSYTNLTIYYSAISIYRVRKLHPFQFIKEYIEELLESINLLEETSSKLIEIPVCYGGDYGPDLELVAMQNNITVEEVIEIHSQPEYLVHMIGFAPGFAFLGGMDEKIGTSRKDVPRLKIPAGSVGIAGKQTGIYPFETPGGWQLIGRTPTKLFLPGVLPPSLLTAGDKIRFYPITEKEYKQLGGQNQ